MAHEVMTATKSGLSGVSLSLYTDGEKVIPAAEIVAVGVSPLEGHERLALAGGAHVDVSRAWLRKHQAVRGHVYLHDSDPEQADTIDGDTFAATYAAVQADGFAEPGAGTEGQSAAVQHVEGVPLQPGTPTGEPSGTDPSQTTSLSTDTGTNSPQAEQSQGAATDTGSSSPQPATDSAAADEGQPSVADLDAVAKEQQAVADTTSAVDAEPAAEQVAAVIGDLESQVAAEGGDASESQEPTQGD